ncbi:MAG: ribonuclease III [Lachnospiraceae bacterium]|nr:ribonuclease III [Lachnospiraceae bacterium]
MLKESDYQELEKKIGYTFQNRALLKQAVTHSSFANEQKINRQKHYERLEFLGDAVLELVSSDFLFQTHPEMPEGQLTKLRASMVCEPALAYCAKDLTLDSYIQLGKGEEATGGRYRDSIVSDVMEAVIGAIYLDGGMEPARTYIHRFILSDLENKQLFLDSKTNLQEYMQQNLKKEYHYRLVEESGPEHDKVFLVEVVMEEKVLGRGKGRTKKAAEQQAAYEALLGFRKPGKRG